VYGLSDEVEETRRDRYLTKGERGEGIDRKPESRPEDQKNARRSNRIKHLQRDPEAPGR